MGTHLHLGPGFWGLGGLNFTEISVLHGLNPLLSARNPKPYKPYKP